MDTSNDAGTRVVTLVDQGGRVVADLRPEADQVGRAQATAPPLTMEQVFDILIECNSGVTTYSTQEAYTRFSAYYVMADDTPRHRARMARQLDEFIRRARQVKEHCDAFLAQEERLREAFK